MSLMTQHDGRVMSLCSCHTKSVCFVRSIAVFGKDGTAAVGGVEGNVRNLVISDAMPSTRADSP